MTAEDNGNLQSVIKAYHEAKKSNSSDLEETRKAAVNFCWDILDNKKLKPEQRAFLQKFVLQEDKSIYASASQYARKERPMITKINAFMKENGSAAAEFDTALVRETLHAIKKGISFNPDEKESIKNFLNSFEIYTLKNIESSRHDANSEEFTQNKKITYEKAPWALMDAAMVLQQNPLTFSQSDQNLVKSFIDHQINTHKFYDGLADCMTRQSAIR
jgi:hypothetical protein